MQKGVEKMQSEINNSTTRNLQFKLPDGWKWVRLGEVCGIIMGQSPKRDYLIFQKKNNLIYYGKSLVI